MTTYNIIVSGEFMNRKQNIYPEDWNDNKNKETKQNNTNTYSNQNTSAEINPAFLLSLLQKGNIDTSEILKNFMPQNSVISSLLPLLQQTKKTVKTTVSSNVSQKSIDVSKFKNVKDYYK